VVDLTLNRRRKPLGQLPAAHFGTRAVAAGLIIDVDELVVESAEKVSPSEKHEYLTKIVTSRGIGWGIRVRGALPESVRDSTFLQQLIVPRRSGDAAVSEAHNRLLNRPLSSLLQRGKYLAVPKTISNLRNYLAVSSYDPEILPLDSLLVIDADSGTTFGWLSSKAFWLWTQVVASNAPSATVYMAYNSFPALDLSPKNKAILESAANTVLRSRGHFLQTSLTELYDIPPAQLLWAHQKLDAVVNELFDLAGDASDAEVIDALISRYRLLAAA
jgi:hypothetical protein